MAATTVVASAVSLSETVEKLRAAVDVRGPIDDGSLTRLVALARAGAFPRSDPALLAGLERRFYAQLNATKVLAARQTLDTLVDFDGTGPRWDLLRVELLVASYRGDLAQRDFDRVSRRLADSHSIRSVQHRRSRARNRIRGAGVKKLDERPDPDFERNESWLKTVRKGIDPGDVAAIDSVIAEAGASGALHEIPDDAGRSKWRRSFWGQVVGAVRKDEGDGSDALRRFQNAAMAGAKTNEQSRLEQFEMWRTRPWAVEAQRGLLLYGIDMARKGHYAAARRSFEDVITYARDEVLIERARAGLIVSPWSSQTPAAVPAQVSERPSITRLQLPRHSTHHPAVLYSRRLLTDWSSVGWPMVNVQTADGLILVSAPDLLACYRVDDTSQPVWEQRLESLWLTIGHSEDMTLPGGVIPAIEDGRFVTRWGRQAAAGDLRTDAMHTHQTKLPASRMRRILNTFVAFELSTGKSLWSTAEMPYWKAFVPAGDPVAQNGRVYLPVVPGTIHKLDKKTLLLSVICVNAADGRLVWERSVADIQYQPADTYHGHTRILGLHAGLRVHEGRLYCSTGNGLLSCQDIRDGMVEWTRSYAGYVPLPRTVETQMPRRTRRPLICDGVVVLGSKDLPGLSAFEARTGRLAWEKPWLPSHLAQPLGADRLLVQDDHALLALRGKDGSVAWQRSMTEGIRGPAIIVRDTIAVPVVDATSATNTTRYVLQFLDAATGRATERVALPLSIMDARLVHAAGFRALTQNASAPQIRTEPTPGFTTRDGVIHIRRQVPRLYDPVALSGAKETDAYPWLCLSEGFLEAYSRTEAGRVLWRRSVRPDDGEPLFAGDRVLLAAPRRVTALSLTTGKILWRTEIGKAVEKWHTDGKRVVGGGASHYAILDAVSGRKVHEGKTPKAKKFVDVGLSGDKAVLLLQTYPTASRRTHIEAVMLPVQGETNRFEVGETDAKEIYYAGNDFWITGMDRHVYLVDLANRRAARSEKPVLIKADMKGVHSSHWRSPIFDVRDGLALIDGGNRNVTRRWVYQRGEAISFITPKGAANYLLPGGRIAEASGRRVRVVDFETGDVQATCTVPLGYQVHACRLARDQLLIVSRKQPPGQVASPVRTGHLRFDVFRVSDGERIAGRTLPSVHPSSWHVRALKKNWSNEVAWMPSHIAITDAFGVHIVPLEQAPVTGEMDAVIAYRAPVRLIVDGNLAEYGVGDDAAIRPVAIGQYGARLWITHDAANLYIAVSYEETRPEPIRGRGRLISAGDFLKLSIRGNFKPDKDRRWDDFRWHLGHNADGHTISTGEGPRRMVGVKSRDANSGITIYELGVPLESVRDRAGNDNRILKLDISVHDSEFGPDPCARWPGLELMLHPFSVEEQEAGLSISGAMPSLIESRWFLRTLLDVHVGEWPAGRGFMGRLLREHKESPFSAWLMRSLHHRLDMTTGTESREKVRALALESGVAQPYLDWYEDFPEMIETDPTKVSPWIDNVRMLGSPQRDAAGMREIFERYIPLLGASDSSIRFFTSMIRVLKPDPEEELALIAWYLKENPGHPRTRDYLYGAWDIARRMGEDKAIERIEKVIQDGKVGRDEAYRFRRTTSHTGHARIVDWHVVGPFPADLVEAREVPTILPHEQGRITLKEQYRMLDRMVRWKSVTATNGVVDMLAIFKESFLRSLGYAASWVHSPKGQWVLMEVGSYGPCSVWVNGRLVYYSLEDHKDSWLPKGYRARNRFPVRAVRVWIPEKWTTILVQSTLDKRGWQFGLEFIDPLGRGPVEGLRVMRPGGEIDVAITALPRPPLPTGGLKAEYFGDRELTNLKLIRMDPQLDFDWAVESPDPRIPWDHYSARWTGRLKPRFREPTTFMIQANDGVRFWLDGKKVLDHWTYHGGRIDQVLTQLETNREHHVTFEFYELTDYSNFRVWWQSANMPQEVIPTECLAASWHLKETILRPRDSIRPTGPPAFAGIRVHPRELWLSTGESYTFQAVPVDQYGRALDPTQLFDDNGQPLDTSVSWSVINGGRLNLFHQYSSGPYLPHHTKQASGAIDANGRFISDGSRGAVTIVARSNLDSTRMGSAVVAVDDLPAIGPFTGQPMTIGRGFSGDIDRARVYTKALSAEQIKAHAAGKELSDNGLLADWTFDDLVDGKFPNLAREELLAEMHDQVRWVKTEEGGYVRYEGGRVEVPDDPLLNFSQAATLEAWVRKRGRGGLVLDRCRWGTVRGFRLEIVGDGIRTQGLYGHGGLECRGDVPVNFWSHVVGIYGHSGLRQIWVDGKMVGERKGGPQVQEW